MRQLEELAESLNAKILDRQYITPSGAGTKKAKGNELTWIKVDNSRLVESALKLGFVWGWNCESRKLGKCLKKETLVPSRWGKFIQIYPDGSIRISS